ncbi:cytochrome C oxidase copper chaperone-domain-containing protein [Aspergillus tamarii]|uniref:Cytochrome C oxidase copper chaperone-domain-containing protein n=1 Tax=Aspergillus tamarii TaxID=41984 RepID=A0A5N6UEW7_ASPTM|nr:cytochrome C oxidase copper chaperone-domain-containing protein [Aspergillus tamarii]
MSWLVGSSSKSTSPDLRFSASPLINIQIPQVLLRKRPSLPRRLPRSQKYDYPDVFRHIPKPGANQLFVQPCCVCKPEKTARDDCMLFSKSDDPQQECKSMIEQYKTCMAGYGFKV